MKFSRLLEPILFCVVCLLGSGQGKAAAAAAAPARPAQPDYYVLRWSDNGRIWLSEVRCWSPTPSVEGVVPWTSLYTNRRGGHDCTFVPQFEITQTSSGLVAKVQLLQHLDSETSQSLMWQGTLAHALMGPVWLGLEGRGIKLEISRLQPDSSGMLHLAGD